MRPSSPDDRAALQQDRVLDLRAADRAALADRRVGAHVAVAQPRARAHDRRAADGGALEPRAGLDHDPALDLRVDQLAVDAFDLVVEHQAVGLEHVLQAPGVLPPAAHDVGLHPQAVVDQPLDRVGDLQLAPGRGLDRAGRVVDRGREHVHAHQREVADRLARLLHQAHHRARLAGARVRQLGDPVVLGVRAPG